MPEKTADKKDTLKKLLLTFGLVAVAAALGALFSRNAKEISESLINPPLTPPPSVFGIVWGILFVLMAIAFFLVYKKGTNKPGVKTALMYFIYQLVFNILWSLLYFQLGLRVAALVDIVILLVYISITTVKFFKVSKLAGLLMLPYLLWVAFATYLNIGTVVLNG